jgi:DNA-binding NarL/FixJ family response regulator
MKENKIIIFDDHKIFSELLAEALNREDSLNVTVADSFSNLSDVMKSYTIDILLLDMDINGISGFEVIEKLSSLKNETKILMLSAETDKSAIKSVLSLDIAGYICKSQGVDVIKEAIYSVLNNETYLCNQTREILYESINSEFFIDITKLTKREKDILKLIGIGLSNDEIAENLKISIHTIKTHRKNIRLKFNLESFNELSQIAIKYSKYL